MKMIMIMRKWSFTINKMKIDIKGMRAFQPAFMKTLITIIWTRRTAVIILLSNKNELGPNHKLL